MIKPYIVYDVATGAILRFGKAQPDMALQQVQDETESVLILDAIPPDINRNNYFNYKVVGDSLDIAEEPAPAQIELEGLRGDVIQQIKVEGLRRIEAIVPALADMKMLDLMIELWPMLDTAQAGPDMLEAKDIA